MLVALTSKFPTMAAFELLNLANTIAPDVTRANSQILLTLGIAFFHLKTLHIH